MWFYHDDDDVHTSAIDIVSINDFRLKEHSLSSPEQQLSHHLFPKLKNAISVTHFRSNDDVMNEVEDFLNGQ